MSSHHPTDDGIDSPESFNEALAALLDAAETNGVPTEGAWECRLDGTAERFDVLITRVRTGDDERA